ncbi:BRO-N domain-containing protein [Clostridium rectalis]|uniref:BRO-N domain-containing protein n=1 Tax=Clostridium rectalis TaxID=2040295 RepID=UPI000F634791|nr:BRO family protein [Clostridium rectalis]
MEKMVRLFNNDIFEVAVKLDNEEWIFDAKKIAKCLGITETKNSKEYVMWRRINQYLKPFGTTAENKDIPEIKKGDFIPESAVYKLAFKANNEVAEKFQDWLAIDVLPVLRTEGAYISDKYNHKILRSKIESTQEITEALNLVLPLLEKASVSPESIALTAKAFYKKAGIEMPFEIESDDTYLTVTEIAKYCGIYSWQGKPAAQAVSWIIKQINISNSDKKVLWEQRGGWQGNTIKYKRKIINSISEWLRKNNHPYEKQTGKSIIYGNKRYKIQLKNIDCSI